MYAVIGGEVVHPQKVEFREPENAHFVGVFLNREDARDAWQKWSWHHVDNAHMRYIIAEVK